LAWPAPHQEESKAITPARENLRYAQEKVVILLIDKPAHVPENHSAGRNCEFGTHLRPVY
jgi:hypothetical protein